jgi:hypothetical protein
MIRRLCHAAAAAVLILAASPQAEARPPYRAPRTAAWSGEMPFLADKAPIYEFGCHEGNYSLPGILAAARQADAPPPGEGKVIGKGN